MLQSCRRCRACRMVGGFGKDWIVRIVSGRAYAGKAAVAPPAVPQNRRSPRLEKPASGGCHGSRTGRGAGDVPRPEWRGDEATGSAASVGAANKGCLLSCDDRLPRDTPRALWIKKLALPRPWPEAPKTSLEVLSQIREDPSYPAERSTRLAPRSMTARVTAGSSRGVKRRGGAS